MVTLKSLNLPKYSISHTFGDQPDGCINLYFNTKHIGYMNYKTKQYIPIEDKKPTEKVIDCLKQICEYKMYVFSNN